MGKEYKMNPLKILFGKDNSESSLKDKRGFFCSELVASAYKAVNLLPDNIPAYKYWPC